RSTSRMHDAFDRHHESSATGRGPAAGGNRKQCTIANQVIGDGAAGISQLGRAGDSEALRIRTELVADAGRTVTRILEVAEKIVMFERRRDQEEGVYRGRKRDQRPPATHDAEMAHPLPMIRPTPEARQLDRHCRSAPTSCSLIRLSDG